jgi:hypothetical protein
MARIASGVSAAYAVGVTGKDVQVQGREHCVTHAVLLHQKSRIAAGQRRIPTAPFIHHQAHFLFRVILIHDFDIS